MVMAGDASRRSIAIAASLAVHAAIVAFLAGRAIVQLDVLPETIELSIFEAAGRTAGPGQTAPELREAAAAPSPPAEPAREPVVEAPDPEPVVKAAPVLPPEPKRVVKKPATATPPALATGTPGASSDAAQSAVGAGSAARASAPAWAPAARVRYEALLFAWMDRHKQYPLLAQRRGLEGDGSVRVRIGRDGRVLERSLTRSTGEPMLDQAALDMVRRANPFPAVPAEYAGESFEFVAPIQYRLR